MKPILATAIEVRKRQRTSVATNHINELKASILKIGLLHPPVCWFDEKAGKWVLSVGECRLKAILEIGKEGKEFFHGETKFQPGHIPITPLGEYLDEIGKFEAEFDENIRREPLAWQDECQALADLHAMRQAADPKHTLIDSGRELARSAGASTPNHPGKSAHPVAMAKKVHDAAIVAQHLDNPKIAQARSLSEATALVYKQEHERVQAALAKRLLAAAPTKPDIEIRHGDMFATLPGLDPGQVDLIIADPPYGIDASGEGFRSRTIHHHNYNDTEENARDVARFILTEGFRIAKAAANLFMFCDIDLFQWLKATGANMGWVPFRTPLVWQKSESEGLAPWGQQGPRRTTEYLFYATKGQKGLLASPVDVFTVKRVPRHERIHAAEKPVELLRRLVECSTLPGDLVLDPCCGSGSTLVACRELKRRAIGIEKDEDYYNTAMANVHGGGSNGEK